MPCGTFLVHLLTLRLWTHRLFMSLKLPLAYYLLHWYVVYNSHHTDALKEGSSKNCWNTRPFSDISEH